MLLPMLLLGSAGVGLFMLLAQDNRAGLIPLAVSAIGTVVLSMSHHA